MNKRLLVVSPYFPPDGKAGGAEMFASAMAEGLARNHAWDTSVVTTAATNSATRESLPDTIPIYRLAYRRRISNSPISVSWPGELKRIIEEINPDVIQVNMPVPGLADLACRLAGNRPVVVYYHFGSMKKGRPLPDLIIGAYESLVLPLTLRKATTLVCGGNYVRDGILGRFRNKTVILAPGVDLCRFRPAADGRPASHVLYVGSLNLSDNHKRLPDLFAAYKILLGVQPKLRLTVVGSGDGLPGYTKLAAEMGIAASVEFLGRLEGDALADAYRQATVLAVPSLRETFGMVITEAMASGLPVVAVAAGGVPALLDNFQDGILVPPRDPAAMADALRFILNDPKKASAMGAAGRRKVDERLGWPRQVAAMDRILDAAVRCA